MGETLAVTVLFELLGSISRTIEPEKQLPLIKERFKGCNSPLYVRLVFDQICVWKSYTANQIVPLSIDECIKALLNRVENAHGKVLVSHALAYVTAAKNGLSDSEVEDLISICFWTTLMITSENIVLLHITIFQLVLLKH